jgi:Rx N-terminal domain
MAEAVVSYVLGRIGEAAYQEALSLYGLGEKIEWAKREFKWVSAFLKDAEAKQNKDARMQQWVKDVREVAYMIEDALDKFLVEVGRGSEKGFLQRARKLPKELWAKHKLVTEIDNITKRMSEIRENCIDFKIMSIESSSTVPIKQPIRPIVIPEIDNTDIVGFKDDINKIRDLLLDHDQRDLRRSVISIVGAGGRGKTTVATKAYKRLYNYVVVHIKGKLQSFI